MAVEYNDDGGKVVKNQLVLNKNGNAKISFLNGDTYDGEWKDGLKHGLGTEWNYPDALAEDN